MVKKQLLAKIILPPNEIVKRLNNKYRKKSVFINIVTLIASYLQTNTIIVGLLGIFLKPIQVILEDILPDEYGGLLFVVHKNT